MNKNWTEPKVMEIDVRATAGGPNYDPEADGTAVYDPNSNKWWTPSGLAS